ncbi:MAG: aldehyde ferredoxin oxidoreductase family protein [Candidatus Hydrothermarchaeota archaeon]
MMNLLSVDLSKDKIEEREMDEDLIKFYLGGRGLGVKLLYDLLKEKTEPLSKENILIFACGPLTGTMAPTSGRFSVTSKSPLTNTIFDSNSGGKFGAMLKKSGHDVILIKGRSKSPVYLNISRKIEILDASDLWGKDTHETTDILEKRHKGSVACIGQAGENLVRYACIINDRHRAIGRGGLGAVMGSKNLKAIVAHGKEKVPLKDHHKFKYYCKELRKLLEMNPVTSIALKEFGTSSLVNIVNEMGILPTRNFQTNRFEYADNISGETLKISFFKGRRACFACPIACGRKTSLNNEEGEGPEYETIWSFGANCGIDDLNIITRANYLCNRFGLDTISTGVTISCAMELSERGFLDFIRFGDHELLNVIKDIALRKGIGDLLAEGSYKLASSLKKPEYSMTSKKLELPGYDPRGAQGQGLGYATSNRGACHLRAYMIGPEILGIPKLINRFSPRGKAGLIIVYQNLCSAIDSLVLCKFVSFAVDEEFFSRLLTSALGIEFSGEDVLRIGERIWNLERLFNIREGFTRKDDSLPRRLLKEEVNGNVVKLDEMLKEYYKYRGWNEEGIPKKEKLEALGLGDLYA